MQFKLIFIQVVEHQALFEKEARGNSEMANFSLQHHPWIKHKGHENKVNDHQLKKLLIVKQILLVST